VTVFTGDGMGHFTQVDGRQDGGFGTSSGPVAVAIADLNGDHRPDLVTANFDAGNVSVLLNAANDAPTAAADGYATAEDTRLSIAAPGMLGNDADRDGDTLTARVVSGRTTARSRWTPAAPSPTSRTPTSTGPMRSPTRPTAGRSPPSPLRRSPSRRPTIRRR
jgi:hypothetical protein